MDDLKERVKILCAARGFTLNRLESECGVAKGYLSKIDQSVPSAAVVLRLASALNVSVDFLLTGSSPAAAPVDESTLRISGMLLSHPELVDICSAYVKASAERQNIICDLLSVKRDAFSISKKEA